MFVLTYEYSDRSSFNICGLTNEDKVALAWFKSADDTNVYELDPNAPVSHWMSGAIGWRNKNHA